MTIVCAFIKLLSLIQFRSHSHFLSTFYRSLLFYVIIVITLYEYKIKFHETEEQEEEIEDQSDADFASGGEVLQQLKRTVSSLS
jgi:hypothetical protein